MVSSPLALVVLCLVLAASLARAQPRCECTSAEDVMGRTRALLSDRQDQCALSEYADLRRDASLLAVETPPKELSVQDTERLRAFLQTRGEYSATCLKEVAFARDVKALLGAIQRRIAEEKAETARVLNQAKLILTTHFSQPLNSDLYYLQAYGYAFAMTTERISRELTYAMTFFCDTWARIPAPSQREREQVIQDLVRVMMGIEEREAETDHRVK